MTKEAIIAEIRKLKPAEQREIAEILLEPTDEEKALVDRRRKEMQKYPERNPTLEQLKERMYGHTTA